MYPVHASIPKETFGLKLDLKPIQNLIYAQAFLTKHTRWSNTTKESDDMNYDFNVYPLMLRFQFHQQN